MKIKKETKSENQRNRKYLFSYLLLKRTRVSGGRVQYAPSPRGLFVCAWVCLSCTTST